MAAIVTFRQHTAISMLFDGKQWASISYLPRESSKCRNEGKKINGVFKPMQGLFKKKSQKKTTSPDITVMS